MKENIRNTKSKDELSENSRDIRENSGNAQNFFFLIFVYIKWLKSLKRHGGRNGVEVIVFNDKSG